MMQGLGPAHEQHVAFTQTVEMVASGAVLCISGIRQDADDLVVQFRLCMVSGAAAITAFACRFNNSAAAVYNSTHWEHRAQAPHSNQSVILNGWNETSIIIGTHELSTPLEPLVGSMFIPGYSHGGFPTPGGTWTSTDTRLPASSVSLWGHGAFGLHTNMAINRINFGDYNTSAPMASGSKVTVYGLRGRPSFGSPL